MVQGKAAVSFVVPCLNESKTLAVVLDRIGEVCRGALADRSTEVVVVDNGSTDNSVDIARAGGARVVHCAVKGYGAAIQCGIRESAHDAVVFADADNTYDFAEAPMLIAKLDEGYALVIGSRLKGRIQPGAMPFLHRYVGTPVLTALLNLLFAGGTFRLSDCNSGFRCLRRSEFLRWDIKSTDMAFASEMLIRALQEKAPMAEVPVSLAPDTRARTPHLRTWRDGMRHLLSILSHSPAAFLYSGVILFLCGISVVIAGALSGGPVTLGPLRVLGLHSMMFGMLFSLVGHVIMGAGLLMQTRRSVVVREYRWLLSLSEDRILLIGLAVIAACLAVVARIFSAWSGNSYVFLNLEPSTLAWTTVIAHGVLGTFNLAMAHIFKRT